MFLMEEKPDIVIEFFKDNVHILLPIIIFGIVMLSLGYVILITSPRIK